MIWVIGVADAATVKRQEAVVLGASLVVALGPVERSRLGVSLDGGYQLQRYLEQSARFDGVFTAWAEERPDASYGPMGHVWWVSGAWHASAGARVGVAWPLRVGIWRGWWPGPAVAGELGLALSTAGWVGLDVQGLVEAPWAQGRISAALTPTGIAGRRLHLGVFAPLTLPEGWPETDGDVWDPDRTPPG